MFVLNSGSSHLLSMLRLKRLWGKKSYHFKCKIWKHLHLMTLMKGRFSQHCILKQEVSFLPFIIFITKVFVVFYIHFVLFFVRVIFCLAIFVFCFVCVRFCFYQCEFFLCVLVYRFFCVWTCVRHYIISLAFLCYCCVILPYILLYIQVVPRNE